MTHLFAIAPVLQQAAPAPTLMQPLFMFGMIFLIFYFLIIRPQQRQRKTHEQAVLNLKRGDKVVTTGGIVGEVVHIREGTKDGKPQATMDDEITMKSAESRLIVERGRIAKIIAPTTPAST